MPIEKPKPSEYSVNFMLEEFRFLKASYEGAMTWRDERFKSFINLIFGTAALLTIIAQLSKSTTELYYSIIIISAILYLYGLFVFSRLVSCAFTLEKYKRAINRVRKYFVDMDQAVKDYLLLPVVTAEPSTPNTRLGSGLLGTTAFTNSLLMLIFGTAVFIEVGKLLVVPSIGLGFLLALISWGMHKIYYSRKVVRSKEKY